jgi:hypothetical protein
MFVTLMTWIWLVKNDHWHPERATDDAYGFGLCVCGGVETVIWMTILFMIGKYIGVF